MLKIQEEEFSTVGPWMESSSLRRIYTYDAQNRLRTAHNNGTLIAAYYYDGKNRQIARSINNVIRFSVWDGWELIEEYGSVRAVAYLQGATGVIKSWTPSSIIYYYQDKLGSTTHVANASGALLESYRYDLYGAPTYYDANGLPKATQASGHGIVDLYAGERWVSELGLYDLRNRFMSPELGRFLQADPIGIQIAGAKLSAQQKAFYPGGQAPETFAVTELNLYRYCHNDPVNRSDPFGLKDREIDPKELKKAEALLKAIEKDSRKDNVTRSQAANKDGTTSDVAKAKVVTRNLMGRFKSDQSREEIPGNKDTVSIVSHVHGDARNGATHGPSEDVDLKTGQTIFILFGSQELRRQGQAILIVPQENPSEKPSQYVRPMIYDK